MEKKKSGNGGMIAFLLILFLICASAGVYGYLNKDNNKINIDNNKSTENNKVEENTIENKIDGTNENDIKDSDNNQNDISQLSSNYEQIDSFNNNGVFEELSFILDGTIQQRRINNRFTIKDAIKINGNILDIEEYEAEFAFQYGFLKKYANYLDEKYTKETGAYSLTREDFENVYKKVYGKECTLDNTLFSDKCYGDYLELEEENLCLNDNTIKYYNSGIFTGYTIDDYYRFVETKTEKNDNTIKTFANIYNTIGECNEESNQSDEDYCENHAKKIGRIELEYKTENNNYIFKNISLYEK